MTNKKFVSARPERNHGEKNSASYTVGTNIHLSASKQRQQNLQTYGYHLTKDKDISVYIVEDEQDIVDAGLDQFMNEIRLDTAQIIQGGRLNETIVIIPAYTDLENPFDEEDLSDESFRSVIQYANLLHEEGGHYLHTDQPTVKECFNKLENYVSQYPRQVQQMLLKICKDIWNAIEDGAIEEAIRNERGSNAAQRLEVKNETFIARSMSEIDPERRQNVTLEFALHIASMDLAKYDTGALRRLLDGDDNSWQFKDEEHKDAFLGIYDELQETVQKSMIEANPAARTYLIFDFLESVVDLLTTKFPDADREDQPDRDALRENQKDDSQNSSGEAQQQQSQGLQENSKQEVEQRHTIDVDNDNTDTDQSTEQESGQETRDVDESTDENEQSGNDDNTVDAGQTDDESDGEGEPGQNADGDNSTGQSGNDSDQTKQNDSDTDDRNRSADSTSESNEETTPSCPSCSNDDVGRLVQEVDAMIAARVNAPFNIRASWVGSVTFVSNDEVCGFRVDPQGTVPRDKIEQSNYKVVDIGSNVEILEPRNRYSETEQVKGFECNTCGHAWVPTIGGDDA